MLKQRYARWMYEWETRLTTRDENRVVRPLDWGFEWIAPFLKEHGMADALPSEAEMRDDTAAEAAKNRINELLIRQSDSFFGYRRPTDFHLEERFPQLYPTNVRPRNAGQRRRAPSAGRRWQAEEGAISALHLARAYPLSRKRSGQCPLVSGPCA